MNRVRPRLEPRATGAESSSSTTRRIRFAGHRMLLDRVDSCKSRRDGGVEPRPFNLLLYNGLYWPQRWTVHGTVLEIDGF